jgi:hypothetical protein
MKTALQLVMASMLLMGSAFAQEPQKLLTSKAPQSSGQTMAIGSAPLVAQAEQPKPLPPVYPSLGEIARQARIAHFAAPKSEKVVETDTLEQPAQEASAPAN